MSLAKPDVHPLLQDVTAWDGASCGPMDPLLFEGRTADDRAEATATCQGCPLIEQCREMGQHQKADGGAWGIWGGWFFVGTEQPLRLDVPVPGVPHGSRNTYSHHRCRCEPCIREDRRMSKAHRDAKRSAA